MNWTDKKEDKDFICRGCGSFYDKDELNGGKCPECDTDENLFNNDLNEER